MPKFPTPPIGHFALIAPIALIALVVMILTPSPEIFAATSASDARAAVSTPTSVAEQSRSNPVKSMESQPLQISFEFKGGALLAGNNSLIQGRQSQFGAGFRAGGAAGIEYHQWLQVLFAMHLAGPQLDAGLADAFGVPGRYDSGTLAVGFDVRLLGAQRWGLQLFAGVGVRAKVMSLSYRNPDATSPEPRQVHSGSGADWPASDVSQHYTGLSIAPQVGLRRTLIGTAGGSQLAVIAMIQPEWTRWYSRGNEIRRDDKLSRKVGAAFAARARSGTSLAWTMSLGVALVF